MATDLSLSSDQQVLSLINESNLTTLSFSEVGFESPIALENDVDGKNTELVVTSKPNGGYKGEVTVKYDRLPIDDFLQYGEAELIVPENPSLEDVVESFNELYDANLSVGSDITSDLELPNIDYVGQAFDLITTETSYAYTGSITVTLRYASEELSDIIANTAYYGLEYPKPLGEKLTGTVEILPNLPTNLSSSVTAVVGDILYIFGGATNNSQASSTRDITRRFDLVNNVFLENGAPSPQRTRYHHGAVINGAIYLYGGASESGAMRDSLLRYNPTTDTWDVLSTSGYGGRLRGGYCGIGNKLYVGLAHSVITGQAATVAKEIIIYDTVNEIWSKIDAPVDLVRFGALAGIDDTLYLIGGLHFGEAGAGYNLQVWAYDTITEEWSRKADLPEGRESFAAVTLGGRIYAYGGNTPGGYSTNLLAYDPNEDTWEIIADIGNYPLRYISATTYNNKIYIPGGSSGAATLNQFIAIS